MRGVGVVTRGDEASGERQRERGVVVDTRGDSSVVDT